MVCPRPPFKQFLGGVEKEFPHLGRRWWCSDSPQMCGVPEIRAKSMGAILRKKHTITNRNDSDRWASVGERFSPLSVLVSYRSDFIRGTDWVRSQYAISGLKYIIFNPNNAAEIRGPTACYRGTKVENRSEKIVLMKGWPLVSDIRFIIFWQFIGLM